MREPVNKTNHSLSTFSGDTPAPGSATEKTCQPISEVALDSNEISHVGRSLSFSLSLLRSEKQRRWMIFNFTPWVCKISSGDQKVEVALLAFKHSTTTMDQVIGVLIVMAEGFERQSRALSDVDYASFEWYPSLPSSRARLTDGAYLQPQTFHGLMLLCLIQQCSPSNSRSACCGQIKGLFGKY